MRLWCRCASFTNPRFYDREPVLPYGLIPGVSQTVTVEGVEDLMASGDSGRTWFPELVDELRASWRPDLSWAAIIDLRERLQAMVEEIIVTRGIKRARVRCFH